MKKLLNGTEAIVNDKLKHLCEAYGTHVYIKVRIADILPIEGSGIDNEAYSYALKAHFDFIITDKDYVPLFAVEFDGPTHLQSATIEKDKIKNQLCVKLGLPLLRIKYRYIETRARGMDFLTWLIEMWFSEKFFYEAQEAGNIPYDESFDPMAIVYDSTRKGSFPYWLSLPCANQIQKWAKEGKCLHPLISSIIGTDGEGNLRGIGFIKVSDNRYALAETAMRAQSFSCAADLFDEIVQIETHSALLKILNETGEAISGELLDDKIKKFQKSYELLKASSYGS